MAAISPESLRMPLIGQFAPNGRTVFAEQLHFLDSGFDLLDRVGFRDNALEGLEKNRQRGRRDDVGNRKSRAFLPFASQHLCMEGLM